MNHEATARPVSGARSGLRVRNFDSYAHECCFKSGVPAEIFQVEVCGNFPGIPLLAEVFRLRPVISFRKDKTRLIPAKTFRANIMQG